VITTTSLWIDSATTGDVLGSVSSTFKSVYGFTIGAMFAGVIGVGCGVCSAVCPRGVLKLENGPTGGRYNLN